MDLCGGGASDSKLPGLVKRFLQGPMYAYYVCIHVCVICIYICKKISESIPISNLNVRGIQTSIFAFESFRCLKLTVTSEVTVFILNADIDFCITFENFRYR